ncbi:IFIT5 protein, partial [Polypterus senegalus]
MQLECHFTWGLEDNITDFQNLQENLQAYIELKAEKWRGIERSYNLLAYINYLQGDNDNAINIFKQAEDHVKLVYEDDFEKTVLVTYSNFAWIYYHLRELSKAQSFLSQIENICKNIPSASRYSAPISVVHGERGWCYLKFPMRHLDKAKACFEEALEQEPDNKDWNNGYAIALYRLEKNCTITPEDSQALKQLRHALELSPEDAFVMVLLGLKRISFKQQVEGMELTKQALKLAPDDLYVIKYAAMAFRKVGLVDQSLKLLSEALEKAPTSVFLLHQLGLGYKDKAVMLQTESDPARIAERDNVIQKGIFNLERATMLRPSFIFAQMDLAFMYALSNKIDRADEIYQKVFEMKNMSLENITTAHLFYGNFLYYTKRCKDLAIAQYKKALTASRTEEEKNKILNKLQDIAEKQLSRGREDGQSYALLGLVHQHRNENASAVKYFKKALLLDPGNEEYLNALFTLQMLLDSDSNDGGL